MSVPSISYLENMDAGNYQRATQDEALERAASQEGDRLARAFLLVAAVHRDAALGNAEGAAARAEDALGVLAKVDEGWTRKTLVQHLEQCSEYLSMGKPLPDLPSGL